MDKVSSEVYFGSLTKAAKELAAADKRGGPLPARFDFSVKEVCAACKQNIESPKKILRCSACKAVIYCSLDCARRDWSTPSMPNSPTHKTLCPDNKRHMEKLPQTQAILKYFPWGRIESDGSFSFDIARGRFGVLGASGYGYWSHRGGPVPHQDVGAIAAMGDSPYTRELFKLIKRFDHLDGKDLLAKKHLSDEEGWRLPPNLIPYRNFSSSAKRPKLVTEYGPILDWDSWYRWRNLPKESPAALLMNFPMSVYQMLVHALEVTSPTAGTLDKRVPLHVHMLGVEVELNYLPLYSEVALLLPHHDIKLVLFGSGVTKLLKEAKQSPGCLASKSPVFTYKALPACGAGSISIFLHSGSPTWSEHGGPAASALTAHGSIPDALVACNAGLGSYPEWFPVIQTAHVRHIPFATTEYAEQSAEHQARNMPLVLRGSHAVARQESEYKIELNPFQRPGQRPIPMYRLPNAVNGFTLVVCKKNNQEGAEKRGVEAAMDNLSLETLD
ncbi:Zinc finger MYND domain-containing protein 15 [Hypsizygus marmoreus]|uniref:Zinc finger MYND domain-containing protein 15 n=1 Tax=Hypsizygus marmoreus TaxID=39966 RepID=A0A369JR28_HYPMA|nr:Zinc finger MYND domain-containing protein 15 [Hypsizygus marmoreus]